MMEFQVAFGSLLRLFAGIALILPSLALGADNKPPPGFTALFKGQELTGWRIPDGDNELRSGLEPQPTANLFRDHDLTPWNSTW